MRASDNDSIPFIAALEAGDGDGVRRIPKSDLHNHCMLGGERHHVYERTGLRIEPVREPLRSMQEMHDWVARHLGRLAHDPATRLALYEAGVVQAVHDGITRLEVGVDVWERTLHSSAASLTEALVAIHKRSGAGIEWIPQLGISRHCPISAVLNWMEPFLELGVFGSVDLSGDELAQPIRAFVPAYREAAAQGLRLKAHVGEWGTADDVFEAVELLGLHEVQHGIAAAESATVMRFLADHDVQLNICVTSNVLLGRVASVRDHPIRTLVDAGVPVTINSDDQLMFGSSVTDEYIALHKAGVLTAQELDAIRLRGLAGGAAA
jgi:adenosine deaminase